MAPSATSEITVPTVKGARVGENEVKEVKVVSKVEGGEAGVEKTPLQAISHGSLVLPGEFELFFVWFGDWTGLDVEEEKSEEKKGFKQLEMRGMKEIWHVFGRTWRGCGEKSEEVFKIGVRLGVRKRGDLL